MFSCIVFAYHTYNDLENLALFRLLLTERVCVRFLSTARFDRIIGDNDDDIDCGFKFVSLIFRLVCGGYRCSNARNFGNSVAY